MRKLILCLVCALCIPVVSSAADVDPPITTVRVTGKVLVPDCIRLGINLGGDAYYSGAALVKNRVRENFEGTSYRQCHFGPVWREDGCSTWFGVAEAWRKFLLDGNGRYTVLSGPSKGTHGTIKDIIEVPFTQGGETSKQAFFALDKKIEPAAANGGILVENLDRLHEGKLQQPHDHWMTEGVSIRNGDVPPGSFGVSSMLMDGTEKRQHIRFSTHYRRYGEVAGTWQVRFWAKRASGSPAVKVIASPVEWGEAKDITPGDDWQKYEVTLIADKVPEPDPAGNSVHLSIMLMTTGGAVLIDDVEAWIEGDENPTAFRDDCVNMLKKFNPGVIRYLQMGGNTLRNTLMPPLRAHAYASNKTTKPGPYGGGQQAPYGLHEMYELCEYLDSEPWYCLPGTLHVQEMRDFMEYLGGPVDSEYGKLRAEMGHPKPWTETFQGIHVEFGNEAWNSATPYKLGGYNGDDYWCDLIAAAKASPFYTSNVIFHAAGQAASSDRNEGIMRKTPNADRFSVAPYLIQSLSKEEAERMDTDEEFFRWAFAWPIRRSRHEDGSMYQNYQLAQKNGMELSIYEVNHHTTHGDGPLEPRNRLTTSIGGGLNVCNNMLQMLREHHVRAQCLFSLVQHAYNAQGIGPVRLWGTALTMRKGHERYRPTFLACSTANRVIRGDLMETVHEGTDPVFVGEGVFNRRRGVEKYEAPSLWSYGFADDRERGLILVNLDTAAPRPVAVAFDGEIDGAAESWLLTADGIADGNEFEEPKPLVKVREASIEDLHSGSRMDLPPFSMLALKWRVQ